MLSYCRCKRKQGRATNCGVHRRLQRPVPEVSYPKCPAATSGPALYKVSGRYLINKLEPILLKAADEFAARSRHLALHVRCLSPSCLGRHGTPTRATMQSMTATITGVARLAGTFLPTFEVCSPGRKCTRTQLRQQQAKLPLTYGLQ